MALNPSFLPVGRSERERHFREVAPSNEISDSGGARHETGGNLAAETKTQRRHDLFFLMS